MHLAAGLSLFTPVPWFNTPDFRAHFFGNAGFLSHITDHGVHNIRSTIFNGVRWPSSAIGCGLVFRFPGMARAEINMVLPLTARQGEMTARGLQMGVGIEFL